MAVVLVAVQAPVTAKGAIAYHGEDYATVHDDQMHGAVCDGEADGRAVVCTWHLVNGDEVVEDDGEDQDCDDDGPFEAPAYKVQICEEIKGCRIERI